MSERRSGPEEQLYERIAAILEDARSGVARTINTEMVRAYWFIGREIVHVDQQGAERAGYGEDVTRRVAARLSAKFGRGFSLSNLKSMKRFYLEFPRGSAIRDARCRQRARKGPFSADQRRTRDRGTDIQESSAPSGVARSLREHGAS